MPAVYLAIAPVLAALFIQTAGNGLVSTLVPLRAAIEGFSRPEIGIIGSTYFIGMLAGCWTIPPLIGRIGYIRAFASCAALTTVSVLGFALVVDSNVWAALRCVMGFAIAGMYNTMESWVNARASNKNRGQALAFYNMLQFSGSTIGQQILRVFEPRSFGLFSLSAIFFALSLIPMAMTRAEPPAPPAKGRVDIVGLYRLAPMGVIGVALIGLSNGTFWTIVPSVIERMQLGPGTVANFMTAVIIGSATSPYPIGRLSDMIDRRWVIIGVALAALIFEVAMFLLGAPSLTLLYALGYGIGGTISILYSLLSAHTNDRSGPEMVVVVASTLLLVYCVGGIIGPLVTSWLMEVLGDRMLFAMSAICHAVLLAYVGWRMRLRDAPEQRVEPPVPASPSNPQNIK
jgi:MFS family permease